VTAHLRRADASHCGNFAERARPDDHTTTFTGAPDTNASMLSMS
jgi:hypothetical protein